MAMRALGAWLSGGIRPIRVLAFLLLVGPPAFAAAQSCQELARPDNGFPMVRVKAINVTIIMPYDFDVIAGGLPTDLGVLNFRNIFREGMNTTLGIEKERMVIRRIRRALFRVTFEPGPTNNKMTLDWNQAGRITEVELDSFADRSGVKVGMLCYQIVVGTLQMPCLQDDYNAVVNGDEEYEILFSLAKDSENEKKVGTIVEFAILDPPLEWAQPIIRDAREASLRLSALLQEGSREAWKAPFNQYVWGSRVELSEGNFGCDYVAPDSPRAYPKLWVHEGQFDNTVPLEVSSVKDRFRAPLDCGECVAGSYEGVNLPAGCAEHLALNPGENHRSTPWCMVSYNCRDSRPGFGGVWVFCIADPRASQSSSRKVMSSGAPRHLSWPGMFALVVVVTVMAAASSTPTTSWRQQDVVRPRTELAAAADARFATLSRSIGISARDC